MSSSICKHLKKLLPQELDGDMPRRIDPTNAVNFTTNVFDTHFWSFKTAPFFMELRRLGVFEHWDLELIDARYVEGKSIREIAEEFNWVSKSTVKRRLDKLHKILEERGYGKGRK